MAVGRPPLHDAAPRSSSGRLDVSTATSRAGSRSAGRTRAGSRSPLGAFSLTGELRHPLVRASPCCRGSSVSRRPLATALYVAVAVTLVEMTGFVIKHFVARATPADRRPEPAATDPAAAQQVDALVARQHGGRRDAARWERSTRVAIPVLVLLALVLCFSRVYLGVHYLGDVARRARATGSCSAPSGSCSSRRRPDVSRPEPRAEGSSPSPSAAVLVLVIGLAAAAPSAGAARRRPRRAGRRRRSPSSPHGGVAYATAQGSRADHRPAGRRHLGGDQGARVHHGRLSAVRVLPAHHGVHRRQRARDACTRPTSSRSKRASRPSASSSAPTTTPSPPARATSDNATGVGLLLEIAARIKDLPTPYTIVFVAFGAEENGLARRQGLPRARLSDVERRATIGMIDLDAPAGGDDAVASPAASAARPGCATTP